MLLYHGSNVEVKYPDLSKSTEFLDFGIGFYLTTNKEQAIMFSRKVVLRAKKRKLLTGTATVSVYEFDLEQARKRLSVLEFEMPNGEWLDYVFRNRQEVDKENTFDIVIGPIANDDVYDVIDKYEDGLYSREEAIKRLKVKKLFNQYTLKTERAINLLQFVSSECFEEDY